jgi:hypothetical protein
MAISLAAIFLAVLNPNPIAGLFDPGPILALSFSTVGALIASRRSRNPLGWIFLTIGLSQGLVAFAYNYATYTLITNPGALPGGPPLSVLGQLIWIPGLSLLLTFALLLYPTGRLPSPRWRVVALFGALPLLLFPVSVVWAWPYGGRAFLEHPEQFRPTGNLAALVDQAIFPLILLSGLASVLSLLIRFHRSRGIERQQLKWFTYAAAVTLAAVAMSSYFDLGLLGHILIVPIIPSIPIAVGIAILRHQLFDIDIIIRRTLVYVVLTAALAFFYFGAVILLQQLFRGLTGQASQAAIVLSTLAIAALFTPLRRRTQIIIDQRFYRRKYDAQQTLSAFAATARDQVELERLTAELLAAVEQTMQPATLSLWLREQERQR